MPEDNDTTKATVTPEGITPAAVPQCAQCDAVMEELQHLREEVAELRLQARTDTWTGLYNYRHLRQALVLEMERTRRTGQPTALVMIDLDHFKQVNDQWGHEVGNQALVATAQVICDITRQLDIPCRYGGEEFSVILPSTDLVRAVQVAERIRQYLADREILVDEQDIGLTASLGVAVYQGIQEAEPEQFIEWADHCLYRAKRQGRNQVCHDKLERSVASAVSREERDVLSDLFGGEDDASD